MGKRGKIRLNAEVCTLYVQRVCRRVTSWSVCPLGGICHQCIRGKHPPHDFLFVVNYQMPHTSIDQPFVDFPLTVQPLIVLCLYIRLIWQELYGVESITERSVHKCTGLKKKIVAENLLFVTLD